MAADRQQDSQEAFAEGTPLVELFGKPGRTKLISVFVDERGNDLSISELARQAGGPAAQFATTSTTSSSWESSRRRERRARAPGTSSTTTTRLQNSSTSSTASC